MAAGEFADQVAVVTGAAQGLGFAIAKLLAERGASVCLLDLNAEGVAKAADRLSGTNAAIRTFALDVADEPAVLATRDTILSEFGRTDVLVNNAGIYPHATLREITLAEWDRVFDTNAKAMFLMTRAFMDTMTEQRYGRVVSIVTQDAYTPKPSTPHYAASKAALLSLIKTFALELAPHQVLVNGVSPGAIATERAKTQDWLEPAAAATPVGRAAEPEDLAEVVLFLASPRNRFVTGETVLATGGLYMG